ncbi:hypothetical protein CDD81_4755 [Ophiocordyceps australis]|uniref:FAD-binding domain-containing protein n=1 Tax=Ophiocordyceps australis TaxID=1399860 RepID=A0A2C5YBL7_9HYPO|nr:hypothetical protein CDD81_4755 [Ophiocordyceps australis]
MEKEAGLEKPPRLRAIIVGAGITGLVAAHAFERAGIDYVLLEKHKQLTPQLGGGIALCPGTLRLLSQLGMLERVHKLGMPICPQAQLYNDEGEEKMKAPEMQLYKEWLGSEFWFIRRTDLLRELHECLEHGERVMLGKEVRRVQQSGCGARVECGDGTVQEGDFVLGTDGTHSIVREAIWEQVGRHDASRDAAAIKTNWRAAVGSRPTPRGRNNYTFVAVPDNGLAVLGIQEPETFVFALWPADREGVGRQGEEVGEVVGRSRLGGGSVKEFLGGEYPSAKGFEVGEGVLGRWYGGRCMVVGDAAHKIHPCLGVGASVCIADAIHLANNLAHAAHTLASPLTLAELEAVFAHTQAQALPPSRIYLFLAATQARLLHRSGLLWRLLWHWPLLDLFESLVVHFTALATRQLPLLDYVPEGPWPEGRSEWRYGGKRKRGRSLDGVLTSVLLAVLNMAARLWEMVH